MIAALALTVAAAALIGAAEYGRLHHQRTRTLARLRSQSPTVTAGSPAAVTAGPAAPPPAGSLPGAQCTVSAGQGRPSPAGPDLSMSATDMAREWLDTARPVPPTTTRRATGRATTWSRP